MPTQFSAGPMADEKLQEMLMLYKSPATIRDMKQTFFYVEAEASTTRVNPLNLFYNYQGEGIQPNNFRFDILQTYYDKIGTTRAFDISHKVSELIDIRVPKDKYVIEINMVECVIESDPSGYLEVNDEIIARDNNSYQEAWGVQPVFNPGAEYSAPDASTPPRKTIILNLTQATKQVQPQTLYVKIQGMDNGEPFNWSVTNSGSYSIDKSHQLLVRHGDVNYSNLTLEFGHMAFTGRDTDRENQVLDVSKNSSQQIQDNFNHLGVRNATPLSYDKSQYSQAKYFDYNAEYYNTISSTEFTDEYYDGVVANFYKGDGGIDYSPVGSYSNGGDLKKIHANNIIQPANRAFARYIRPEVGVTVQPYWTQGKPLFYSQQTSKIGFRFMIRCIHTF